MKWNAISIKSAILSIAYYTLCSVQVHAQSHVGVEPFFDFTASFRQQSSTGRFDGSKVYDGIYVFGMDAAGEAIMTTTTARPEWHRLEGYIEGINPGVTIIAGAEVIRIDGGGPFVWEGVARSFRFNINASPQYNLLAELKQKTVCREDRDFPPQKLCLEWWNSESFPERRQNTNCLGYAKNEATYYGGLGPNRQWLTFPVEHSESSDAIRIIRNNMHSTHGWRLLSTDPDNMNLAGVPRLSENRVVALVARYVQGGGVQDFHVMRRELYGSSWSEKGGSQPVRELTSDQVKAKIKAYWNYDPVTNPVGGQFFIGYFYTPAI